MNTQTITKVIFWLGFLSFLATSIPHTAWMYHLYEPDNSVLWWILAYAMAVGIDVLIAWLAFIQSGASTKTNILVWLFIAALCTLSYYGNYLYDMAHNPIAIDSLWNIQLFGGVTTTGYITPIIVSALPIFCIAYTMMLQLINNVKHETLLEKAARLEQEKIAKERIREATRGTFTGFIKDAITSISDIKEHTATTLQRTTITVEPLSIRESSDTTVEPSKTFLESLQTVTESPSIEETSIEQETNDESTDVVTLASMLQTVLPLITPSIVQETSIETEQIPAIVSTTSNGHSLNGQTKRLETYVPKAFRNQ